MDENLEQLKRAAAVRDVELHGPGRVPPWYAESDEVEAYERTVAHKMKGYAKWSADQLDRYLRETLNLPGVG